MKAKQKFCDGCGELRDIWRNVMIDGVRNRLCRWCCNSHDASQGKKHKPTRSLKPIAPRSPKRQKQDTQYNKDVKVFKLANPYCKAGIPGHCTGKTTDVHHIAGRIGDLLLFQPLWLPVCRACHDWIEAHPIEAKELGYSKSKTNTNISDGKK